jgi:L-lactate permease
MQANAVVATILTDLGFEPLYAGDIICEIALNSLRGVHFSSLGLATGALERTRM